MTKLALMFACVSMAAACADPAETPDVPTFTARIRGPLAAPTVADAKTYHDGVAQGGEATAKEAGDVAHLVGLGITDLGTPLDEFLALDRWDDGDAALGFYADPNFAAALRPLFSAAPDLQLFERHPEWTSWGELGAARASGQPYWYVVVEGRLKLASVDDNHAAHDAIASAGEEMARAAGDIAHLPHLAAGDDRAFFNVDVWTSKEGMLARFADPQFQAAIQSLFEARPDVRIYQSTAWYQWSE